ncbi:MULTISPECIES: bacteriocin immunity protein [unclassified Pseudomonas]|uniref:bacteriocin immunity protein n=1 Tax=Pseudomonas TaxID=286 RepID=UPI000D0149CF|nr:MULTISPECIES: bacteriocin immunity protein [unclassified Pseudomonas]PRN04023.1 bacteriocin immunity protein [Pseudomonas sp. LLC-1]PYG74056.1 colicin immunity protein/pyocin immunity protein [Pseudomonas sp. RV120224-01c]PYG78195.1 colicin immunity protein/pyocin immunity protein [Pseudomonas sp. RV120224-01b]
MKLKQSLSDYTELEFLELVSDLYEDRTGLSGVALENHRIESVLLFEKLTEHPDGSDVIYYPPQGADASPQGVVNRVKAWRAANGKPGFKPA